jgi:hypothetical protein
VPAYDRFVVVGMSGSAAASPGSIGPADIAAAVRAGTLFTAALALVIACRLFPRERGRVFQQRFSEAAGSC